MRKFITSIAFLVLILFPLPGEKFTATVLKVADGDTIAVYIENMGKVKLRLLWIDTPEKYSSEKLDRDAFRCGVSRRKMRQLGYKASAYAHRTFHVGDRVVVDLQGREHHKRALALVWDKYGRLYNVQAVADGYACIYTKAWAPPALFLFLRKAEREGKGLWGLYPNLMRCLCGTREGRGNG